MADNKIYFKKKDYDLSYQKQRKEFEVSDYHPLQKDWGNSRRKDKKPVLKASKPLIPASNPLSKDPLSRIGKQPDIKQSSIIPQSQPLLLQSQIVKKEVAVSEERDPKKEGVSPWMLIREEFIKAYDIKKENILMTVENPFGSYGTKMEDQLRMSSQLSRSSALKKQTINTKQIEIRTYLEMLEDYKKQLKTKWEEEDKVMVLQLTIQATKLLHDTQKAKFHALKFAYVIDIVESFGIFVFERIKSLSFPGVSAQKVKQIGMHQLTSHNIPDSAQTICRNWLLKIGAIRELIPRSIIETTLLRLYFFIDGGKRVKHVLYRLAKTNRCYGQYINSIFFSTFLIRIGTEVLPKEKEYILNILDDVFFYIKQGKTKFNHPELQPEEFYKILEPFFKTAFESLGENLDEHDFKRLTKSLPPNPHQSIMKNLISAFNLELVGLYCVDLMKMVQRVPREERYSLYAIFLKKLSNAQFVSGKELIGQLWEYFGDIEDTNIFLEILAPFVEIIFLNFKGSQRLTYINKILDKFNTLIVNQEAQNKEFFTRFEEFLASMLSNPHLFETFTVEPFLQTITYFPKAIKQKISRRVASLFIQREETAISDPMIVNTMLTLIKSLEKTKQTTEIVMTLIRKVDFANDFEGQLNFYADVRAVFGYISEVAIYLINKTILLAIKVRRLARGKIRPFLQACIAYCYISIPLIESHRARAQLYLYAAEVSLSFNLISQSNDLLKSSIKSLTECNQEPLQQIYYIFQKLINFLIVTPDDPEADYLFLFNGMVNALDQIQAKQETKLSIYTDFIVYLSTQVQDRLPIHIEGVISNDQLFRMKEFREAIIEKLEQIFSKLQSTIETLNIGPDEQKKFKAIVNSTGTLANILQYSERLQKYFKTVGKTLNSLQSKTKDQRLLVPFKHHLKSILQRLADQEYSVTWPVADRL